MSGNKHAKKGIMMQGITSGNSRRRAKLTSQQYVLIAVGVIIGLTLLFGVISEHAPRNYYLKDIKVELCTVTQREQEDDKFYIKVTPAYQPDFYISEDNSWFEVSSDFYNGNYNQIGVKYANVDVYKRKYLGIIPDKGQTYEKNEWYIEEVYKSLDDANAANPAKTFTKAATIKKKKITQKGDCFFVINYDQKSMPVMVEKDVYNKYNKNDGINCEFESIGDLTKFVKIAE
jgi:hypothetical protein